MPVFMTKLKQNAAINLSNLKMNANSDCSNCILTFHKCVLLLDIVQHKAITVQNTIII